MNKNQLYQDTLTLLRMNEELVQYLTKAKEMNEPFNFYEVVKPNADRMQELVDRWRVHVLEWIKEEKPKHLHPNQIENTHENVLTVSVQAFFPDTREKRFMELIRSNKYIYEIILNGLDVSDEI